MLTSKERALREEGQKRLAFDMLAESTFQRVTSALGEAAIPVAPVKGIVLSRWLYRDVRERPYVDIDLLVSRTAFARAAAVIERNGWRVFYQSAEMGELSFMVGRVAVELHAEFGRVDLSRLTVDEVLARAQPDLKTFRFPTVRIDDVDHFLLLVLNVVKDGFLYANPHQPDDLHRLLDTLQSRWREIVSRASVAGLQTALEVTTAWMVEEHRSALFVRFQEMLPPPRRRLFASLVGVHRKLTSRQSHRLKNVGALLGLGLATLTPDQPRLRYRGFSRVIRRGAWRGLGRDPG